jgi:hypothetical protein
VDSPQGLGVKVMGIAYDARLRLGRWIEEERERIADMIAEARARLDLQVPAPAPAEDGADSASMIDDSAQLRSVDLDP